MVGTVGIKAVQLIHTEHVVFPEVRRQLQLLRHLNRCLTNLCQHFDRTQPLHQQLACPNILEWDALSAQQHLITNVKLKETLFLISIAICRCLVASGHTSACLIASAYNLNIAVSRSAGVLGGLS